MSSGPTRTGTKLLKFRKYYHLHLEKKDWCTYYKDCPIENNVGERWCWVCKYCKKLDVPTLLRERGRDKRE